MAVERLFVAYPQEIAGVIVEPVIGNMGCIPPAAGFLLDLRGLCTRHGALLIFDEVMTGFRVAFGGAQGLYGITPDLTCLGKIIGGGLPVGAYGGRGAVMEKISPLGPVYQAGTLSGNPLAMIAGIATLSRLADPHIYETLGALGARLEAGRRGLSPSPTQRTTSITPSAPLKWRALSRNDTTGVPSPINGCRARQ